MAKKKVQRTLLNSIWSPKKLSDGMAGEPLPRNNKRVHSKIRNLGNRIGKHAKAIMDKRENENEKTTTRESKRDSKA